MKRLLSFVLIFCAVSAGAQLYDLKGIIKDGDTGETLIGATVILGNGSGTVTGVNGQFKLQLAPGKYEVSASYVGYETEKQSVTITTKTVNLNFNLHSTMLHEVEIAADVAKSRETPIAYSNITSKMIQEELGTRDLPMVLNSTPGAYATEQGGGSGDARVTIRGFDQRNVAVMVDGVPVNDMENGQVYWSNWDGLGEITRTMQVQRGLGASKLAIASVGGTINILTKGIDQKRNLTVKQEVNNYGLYRTAIGFNSGNFGKGWGVTLAGSRKWGSNWADATFTDAWSYFVKIQKQFTNHLFSISANGAPQKHGMRFDRLPVAVYNKEFSDKLGINSDSILAAYNQVERGLTYNPNWGSTSYDVNYMGNSFPDIGNDGQFNDRVNYYHKPQFNLSHFWTAGEKLTVSTVAYLSIGKGGGTGMKNSVGRIKETGQLNIQSVYDGNMLAAPSVLYHPTERAATNYLRSSNNDHFWYGVLSSWNYRIKKNLSALFGVDARYYRGTHYQTVYDLMGGDYAIDSNSDANQVNGAFIGDPNFQNAVRRAGDKIEYYNDAYVKWGGFFGQLEYKKDKWTTFLTVSGSRTGYQRVDYYREKDLVIDGEVFEQVVGHGDRFFYNGTDYLIAAPNNAVTTVNDTTFIMIGNTQRYIIGAKPYTNESSEARYSTTPQKWYNGGTIKAGANFNINDHQNVFMNLGYLNLAPRMNLVFDNNNQEVVNSQNQKVYALEGGYSIHHPAYAANVNFYYTNWQNKPPSFLPQVNTSDGTLYYNILGLDALHKGVEVDFIYKGIKQLEIEGVVSLGDWKTTSGSKSNVTDENGNIVAVIDFSARNVHVGDAAQTQFAGSVRYEIIKRLYIKARYTYFDRNFANFDPTLLVGENRDRESWRMPAYGLLDLFAGYDFTYWDIKFTATAGVNNALGTVYLSDAQNGTLFNASTATIFMGMGRRMNFALRLTF
jgi:iron complex outermembrane receptor protein